MPEILSSGENQLNGVGGVPLLVASSETVGSKRQRRPSVRLGDIGGDQPYDSHVRRSPHPHPHPLHLHLHNNGNKHWKLAMKDSNNHSSASGKTSKTRTLFHLSSSETLDGEDKEGNLDGLALSSWKVKDSKKRAFTAKRVRSNWVSKVVDEGDGGVGAGAEGDDKYGGGEGENIDNGYRDFDVENSESPLKEQSPVHSLENLGLDGHGNERDLIYRRPIRARGVVSEGPHDGVELSGPSDTDWKCGTSGDRNGNNGEDGVRIWLNGLGLGRYAPVFEIHEVDDEVLPMLTLDDLKDMGINAVGSRRKMYCAIQKLGKGFS